MNARRSPMELIAIALAYIVVLGATVLLAAAWGTEPVQHALAVLRGLP